MAGNWIEIAGAYGFTATGNRMGMSHADTVFLKLTAESFGINIAGNVATGSGWWIDDTIAGTSRQITLLGNRGSSGITVWKGGTIPDGDLYHDISGSVRVQGTDRFRVDGRLSLTDNILVSGIAAGSVFISSWSDGSTAADFYVTSDGKMWWSDGTGAGDTKLERLSANQLYTPDSFRVGTDLKVDGNVGFYNTTPIAQQTGVGVDAASIHAAGANANARPASR